MPRVLTFVLQITGWIIARLPQWLLRALCVGLGEIILRALPRRRRLVFSNLDHAFPGRSREWQTTIARESARRLVETGLLSLASPYLGEARLREIARLDPDAQALLEAWHREPRPVIVCSPHLAHWEAQTWLGLISNVPIPEFGVIYRPLRNPRMDAFVKRTRERFGMRLLSRKDGFQEALKILRRRGTVGILFDQNSKQTGALVTLFGRVTSTSELPGLMAEKYRADVVVIHPRRTGFWRVNLHIEPLSTDHTVAGVTIALNQWLENALTTDEDRCASWLWSHDRWRTQYLPEHRLRLEAKRNLLAADMTARNWPALPRLTRCFVRLPDTRDEVTALLPHLSAIRESRPDMALTLIGDAAFAQDAESAGVADRFFPIPTQDASGRRRFFRQLQSQYPDLYLVFNEGPQAGMEAQLTGCPQRFGLERPGRHRRGLTHTHVTSKSAPLTSEERVAEWWAFLQTFGLPAGSVRPGFALPPSPPERFP